MTETQLHQQCTVWFHNEYPDERQAWHHNDNNSENKAYGSLKKSMGVTRGVWDIEWLVKVGVTVWIEFKVGRNTLSKEQKEFMSLVRERSEHHLFFVVRTVEEFINLVKQFI